MVTRVTNFQTTSAFINQIFELRGALDTAREEVGTGFKISNPSDDPANASVVAQFQSTIQRLTRQKERIASATGFLETQEGLLNSAESLMLRAREIGTQAANETMSPELRATLATEVFQLRDTMVALANNKYQGAYVYGGLADNTAPFGESTYVEPADPNDPASERWIASNADGADQTRTVALSDFDSVRVNTAGSTVFSNAISSLERLGRALSGYRTTPEDLSTLPTGAGTAFNFPSEYTQQTQAILDATDAVESARNNDIVRERTSVGSRLSRVSTAGKLVETVIYNTETARSGIQDADVFDAATRLANLQTSLQALLASGSRINDLTLLNFL